MSAAAIVRRGRDDDAAGVIALIAGCWSEYAGCVMDLDGEVPELRGPASYYAAKGGALWVAEAAAGIVGMVATRPLAGAAWELCKMYVAADQRGGGLAAELLAEAEAHACARGGRWMKLWSDTRFTRAHRFYEKYSYVRSGPLRALHDLSNSVEFPYAKPLVGLSVQRLDAAAAAAAETRLTLVLRGCIEAEDAVCVFPPLPPVATRGFRRQSTAEVAAGRCMVFAAWLGGEMIGTVQLRLAAPPEQPCGAWVQELLVLPKARRCGVARRLVAEAEVAAAALGHCLLLACVCAGGGAEFFYRALGWHEAGRIARAVRLASGEPRAAVIFSRNLLPAPAGGDEKNA